MTTPPLTIDCQVHCYERNHPERPWQGHLEGPEEVTGDAMVAARVLPYATPPAYSCPITPPANPLLFDDTSWLVATQHQEMPCPSPVTGFMPQVPIDLPTRAFDTLGRSLTGDFLQQTSTIGTYK